MRLAAVVVAGLMLVLGLGLAGCEQPAQKADAGKTAKQEPMAKCPVCSMKAPEGTYCAKCNAVCTKDAMVSCPKCGNVKAGTRCPKARAYHFSEKVKCCGAEMMKGSYCAKDKCYAGCPNVPVTKKGQKPGDKTQGACPMKAKEPRPTKAKEPCPTKAKEPCPAPAPLPPK